jgi:predicted amidohydrolase
MKVAVIQMVSGADVAANVRQARELLEQAAQAGAELAILPEYFCLIGHNDAAKLAIQEQPGAGPLQAFLAQTARDLGLWLVGGTIPVSGPDSARDQRVYNTSLVFGPDGVQRARYDKIHLFKYDNGRERYDESDVLYAGNEPVTFDIDSRDGQRWRVGMSVCYDLRFPELYRHYADRGAHLLLAPSAFTHTTGQDHWEVLLRSRAVENLAFMAAAAQGGKHDNGRRTWGHAMLVDPWGAILDQKPEGAGVVVAELDFERITQCRSRLPALEHRGL